MPRLNLILLGPPRIEHDDVQIKLDTKKAFAFLTYLALNRQTHRRDSLVDLLWPNSDQRNGRALLRSCLHNINKVLGDGTLHSDRETVALNPDTDLRVDVDQFRSLLAECKTHGHPSDDVCLSCLKPLKDAVGLYHGDFLQGFSLKDSVVFDDWQSTQSQSLRSDLDVGLERLIRCLRIEGDLEKAIEYGRRWLELEATNEEAHRQLVELYARSGRRNTALRQYEECVRILEEEKSSSPQEETVRLYEEIQSNTFPEGKAFSQAKDIPQEKDSSTEKSLSAKTQVKVDNSQSQKTDQVTRHNLPRQLTSFVGRKKEIAEVKRLLSTTYLLTLTGSGGCGKTRLALEVATQLVGEYEDGVWVVELASLSDPALVPQEVASALNVSEQPDRSLSDTLSDYLKSKSTLLILDNCEHLIGACATLTENLLRSCPDLKIIAGSREALGIPGELTYRVPSLSLPDPEDLPALENIREYEALSLFIERASFNQPTFVVTDENIEALTQICHRLDGIPLALELAAARVKTLSTEQILERLDDRFRLLTGGSRTALPRQQTLRSTIDWSYNQLSEKESALFNRLSVFIGGWTLEAAEAICSGEGLEEYEILDLLTQLMEKSLAVIEDASSKEEGEARYHLLETVRQYGRDKLLESGEASVLRDRHLEWYLELAERLEPELLGPDQVELLDWLETEHDNMKAALEWSQGSGGKRGSPDSQESPDSRSPIADRGLRLAGALGLFWWARGYDSEGQKWLEEALSAGTISVGMRSARAKALYFEGWILNFKGDYGGAVEVLEESLALYRELEENDSIGWPLNLLGIITWQKGDYVRGRAMLEESLSMHRESGDKLWIAASLFCLGILERHYGDYERAKVLLEENLALNRELGNKGFIHVSLMDLGYIACSQGDYDRAKKLGEEGLSYFREIGNKRVIGLMLRLLAFVALGGDENDRASDLFKEGLTLCWESGAKLETIQMLEGLARVAVVQEDHERSARLLGAAEGIRDAIGAPLPPADYDEHEGTVTFLKAELGEEAFAAVWTEGGALALEEAVEYALTAEVD